MSALTRVQYRTKRILEQFEIHGTLTSVTLAEALGLDSPESMVDGRKLRHAIGDLAHEGWLTRTEHKSRASGRRLPLFAMTTDGADQLAYIDAIAAGKAPASSDDSEIPDVPEAPEPAETGSAEPSEESAPPVTDWDVPEPVPAKEIAKSIVETAVDRDRLKQLVEKSSEIQVELQRKHDEGEEITYTEPKVAGKVEWTEEPLRPIGSVPPGMPTARVPALPAAKPLAPVVQPPADRPEDKIVPLRPVAQAPGYPVLVKNGNQGLPLKDKLKVLQAKASNEHVKEMLELIVTLADKVENQERELAGWRKVGAAIAEMGVVDSKTA